MSRMRVLHVHSGNLYGRRRNDDGDLGARIRLDVGASMWRRQSRVRA